MSESKYSEGKDGGDSKDVDSGGWDNIDFGEIEIGEKIGGGGIGVIYNGWWRGEPVALKTLFDSRIGEDLKREYMDELLVMSKVKHSNIVTFLGASMIPPNLCFVMEICECSLYSLLHTDRVVFSEKENITMATDIACAMEYLHARTPAIIHRDLKSHNVLRAYNGSMKLCDFGLVMNKNTTAGTPCYMAPELFENRSFNKKVDVYAFGMILWELFAMELPFKMLDVQEIRRRVCNNERPRIPSYCSTRVTRLIEQCWHQKSDDRPEFGTIVDELLEMVGECQEYKHTEKISTTGDALDSLMSFK